MIRQLRLAPIAMVSSLKKRATQSLACSDDGFTMIESLVALAILALVAGASFQSLSLASRSIGRAQEMRGVQTLASLLIAEASANPLLSTRDGLGEDGKYNWRVAIFQLPQDGGDSGFVGCEVTIRSPRGQTYRFATILEGARR